MREAWRSRVAVAMVTMVAAGGAQASEPERVTLPGPDGVTLQALLFKPSTVTTAMPVVLALHGCGGNFRPDGSLVPRVMDWSARWTAQGYAVLWPDSFGSRGLPPQCTVKVRSINPADRARDALATLAWLGGQAFADTARIGLVGWSHGGSTALRTVAQARAAAVPAGLEFKTAIAFYPGCRAVAEQKQPWATRVPLTILMGGADNWTPPEPCRALGARANVRYVEYPGAYHDFDAPNSRVRERTNLTFTADGSGRAMVGTDPTARAAAIGEVERIFAEAFKR
jgi:dienelactone hydrolase